MKTILEYVINQKIKPNKNTEIYDLLIGCIKIAYPDVNTNKITTKDFVKQMNHQGKYYKWNSAFSVNKFKQINELLKTKSSNKDVVINLYNSGLSAIKDINSHDIWFNIENRNYTRTTSYVIRISDELSKKLLKQ